MVNVCFIVGTHYTVYLVLEKVLYNNRKSEEIEQYIYLLQILIDYILFFDMWIDYLCIIWFLNSNLFFWVGGGYIQTSIVGTYIIYI